MIFKSDWATNNIDYILSKLKEILIKNKKSMIIYLILIMFLTLLNIVMFNNYKWYDTTIVKIIKVQDSFDHETKGNNNEIEKYYNQQLVGTIMNGELKGNVVNMENTYSSSGVFDDTYKVGDEVFITLTGSNEALTGSISGLKRDKYMVILSSILLVLILLVAKKRGIFTIMSLVVNIFIFWFALDLYKKGTNLLFLSNCMVILFTSVSLLLISGFKKSTFVAILSTLASIGLTMILLKITMSTTDGVDYAFMELITSPNDLHEIFLSQMLLGGLGAIMDVSITMSSTINELMEKDNSISLKNLISSGREVGYDIMGTMINVMLFTYMCGSIPLTILKMKTNIKLITIISLHMPMELYRFLLGSIGILLTIPISLFISILVLKQFRRSI